jgi:hypothetical protein
MVQTMTQKFDDLCAQVEAANAKLEAAEHEQAMLMTENMQLKHELIKATQPHVSTIHGHVYVCAHSEQLGNALIQVNC